VQYKTTGVYNQNAEGGIHFADPRIGCVCGHLIYTNRDANVTAQIGSLYWRSEELIKRLETRTGSVMGADGSLFAVRRRLAMGMAKRLGMSLEFQQVEQILRLAEAPSAGKKEVLLNEKWKVVREANRLHFEATRAAAKQPRNYEYTLAVPGELQVNETGTRFRTSVVIAKRVRSTDTEKESQLLKKASLAAPLTVRNWRPGDRFWPAHSKAPKKVKELLQKLKIPVSSRQVWPVVVSGAELVWVRGFPVPAKLAAEQNEVEAVLIEEITLPQEKHRGE